MLIRLLAFSFQILYITQRYVLHTNLIVLPAYPSYLEQTHSWPSVIIMDPTYPLVPIANFIACALIIISLFHMVDRSWNVGVFVFALWVFLASLSTAINTIIWSRDTNDRAPIWCDICTFSTEWHTIINRYWLDWKHHILQYSLIQESRYARLLSHVGSIKLQDCKWRWSASIRGVSSCY